MHDPSLEPVRLSPALLRPALVALGVGGLLALLGLLLLKFACAQPTGPICGGLAAGPPWLLLWLIGASPALVLTWLWRAQHRRDQAALARRRLILDEEQLESQAYQENTLQQPVADPRELAERFGRAVELLGAEKVETRLGGIFALELVVQDAARYRGPVVATLAAFVRQNAPLPLVKETSSARLGERVGEDIQAAIGVLGGCRGEQAETQEVDLSATNLRRIQLRGLDLRGLNFKRANLRWADLEGADLRGAVLSYAELSGDLREVDLDRSERFDPRWAGANLRGADLRGADLSHADLRGVRLAEANLGLRDAQDAASATELFGADLRWAELTRASLQGARLVGAKLGRARLAEADLSRANLSKALLADADLQRANLSEANLSKTDLRRTRLKNTINLLASQLEAAAGYQGAELDEALEARLKERKPEAR